MAAADHPPARKKRKSRRYRGSFKRHGRLGLFAATFLVLLVVTGVLINHAPELGFDRAYVSGGWVSGHYGFDPESPPVGYEAGGRWLVVVGETLFLDGEPAIDGVTAPRGAVQAGPMLVFAEAHALFLLTEGGKLIERLDAAVLPSTIDAIGLAEDGRVAVRVGDRVMRGDEALLIWLPGPAEGVVWSKQGNLPKGQLEQALEGYRGPGIPVSRLLADIHSGRIIGSWGPWLVDGLSLVFLLLVATGLLNWFRARR